MLPTQPLQTIFKTEEPDLVEDLALFMPNDEDLDYPLELAMVGSPLSIGELDSLDSLDDGSLEESVSACSPFSSPELLPALLAQGAATESKSQPASKAGPKRRRTKQSAAQGADPNATTQLPLT
eukprot:m.50083 g.50083  ORF g.50083 m.50083 type:complete len:124 (-) comp48054_c0_seq2:504-875(-)